jgi:hypothetical protein
VGTGIAVSLFIDPDQSRAAGGEQGEAGAA